ncbi:MAG: M3 family oligoendopeptidase [Firmicutes bacterium]|nr:M3 family oligoendopeptidase [Bacillota bacterium]
MGVETWKFSELKFPKPDLRVLKDLYADAIERVEQATSGADVMEIIYEANEIVRKVTDLLTVTFIHYTMDTTNEKYAEDQRWVDENQQHFVQAAIEFNEALYRSPYKEYVEENLGSMYFAHLDIQKKSFSEKNIELRQREAELVEEYKQIIASCSMELNGEERSFMTLQNLLYDKDRDLRRSAFREFSRFLAQNETRLEEIWDELIKTRNKIGQNLGFENYIPVAYLERERLEYGQEEVANFRKQIVEEIVPLCSKLYEAQAKRLGVEKFMAYDEKIDFPKGTAHPLGDKEYMINKIFGMFREMSAETEEFIDFMNAHELIDYQDRPGKAEIEYSTTITSRKAPFVFSHFNGTAPGVTSLVSALGHAFASYRASRSQMIEEYYSASSDIMEIHSMSMTMFANRYADRFFGDDAKQYEFSNLQELMTFIPFGAAVDEFQHICYSNPEMAPKERTLTWRELEKKYMPWRKYDEDDEFMNRGGYWYHKLHFFGYPFYYIEYCLATVNSMEMNRKYVTHPTSAWKEYLAITDIGGSEGYLDILKLANLTPAYEDGAVKQSISYVKEVLEKYIETH